MRAEGADNGIDELLKEPARILGSGRVGLVSHPASTDRTGCPSAVRLRSLIGDQLAALFSPEHGFFGIAAAGEKVSSARHPAWGIPIHSLYGKTRRPSAAMMKGLDTVVYDLQDLSIRCYTYVSTLRYLLEEADRYKVRVVVTDRPNPLAHIVDGPMLDPEYESFVGNFPAPLVYGLTAGEAALWLKKKQKLKVELEVVPVKSYRRGQETVPSSWVSPSPAMRYPHTALCYPVTVCYEALPAIDYGRTSLMPFEVIGAEHINADELADRLNEEKLPGMIFHPIVYEKDGRVLNGVRMHVMDRMNIRPAAASVAVLTVLQSMIGSARLWKTKGSRGAFFDKLYGTDSVRRGIQSGAGWRKIVSRWPLKRWEQRVKTTHIYPS